MKKYLVLILVSLCCYGCSKTTYTITPFFGYDLEENSQLIVAKFQNAPNDLIAENATRLLQELYTGCNTVAVVPYDSVQNIFYENVSYFDPIWETDVSFLVKLYETTRARYLLVGKVLNQSESFSPVSVAETYATGQIEEIKENWIMLEFTLYDLATSEKVFQLNTRTKAGQYNHEQDDGSVMSIHAPVGLLDKAFEKSREKLSELCQCER